jgi:hypothetical protein
MQSFTSISFKNENGLWHANGIAKLSSAGVVLEFENKLFGLVGAGVKEVRIALAEILDVRFRKGVLKSGAKIEIRTKSFSKLAELPNKDGKLTLKIIRDDFERARDAVAKLQKDMEDHAASLPPPHEPLASLFDESEDETKKLDNR